MAHTIEIRPASAADRDVIVDFNCRLAEETEDKTLDPAKIAPGVAALLADEQKGRYYVAVAEGRIIGQVMFTYEWSDWRNGWIWWLQSVYVAGGHRRQGVFRRLFERVSREAETNPGVVGIRLYVEDGNGPAQSTYAGLGLHRAGYHVMERLFDQ